MLRDITRTENDGLIARSEEYEISDVIHNDLNSILYQALTYDSTLN